MVASARPVRHRRAMTSANVSPVAMQAPPNATTCHPNRSSRSASATATSTRAGWPTKNATSPRARWAERPTRRARASTNPTAITRPIVLNPSSAAHMPLSLGTSADAGVC